MFLILFKTSFFHENANVKKQFSLCPDLAKFAHFGKFIKSLAIFWGLSIKYLAEFWTYFCNNNYSIGQIFILEMAKIENII